MIKGKLHEAYVRIDSALTSPLLAAQNASEGQTLKLAIGPEPTEGFDPMLGAGVMAAICFCMHHY